jgi:hypothetical protein
VSTVYTERLLIANTGNVWTAFTVPPGKRAVVMTLLSSNAGSAASLAQAAVGGWTVWARSVPVGGSVNDVNLRLVAYAGEHIEARPAVSGCVIIASGYLFDDAAGARAAGIWEHSSGPADLDSVTGETPA